MSAHALLTVLILPVGGSANNSFSVIICRHLLTIMLAHKSSFKPVLYVSVSIMAIVTEL
jgi:hypothetical protein